MTTEQLESKYGPVVARVKSAQEPDKVYEVRSDGRSWSCQCPGYRFRRACRHINAAKEDAAFCDDPVSFGNRPVKNRDDLAGYKKKKNAPQAANGEDRPDKAAVIARQVCEFLCFTRPKLERRAAEMPKLERRVAEIVRKELGIEPAPGMASSRPVQQRFPRMIILED